MDFGEVTVREFGQEKSRVTATFAHSVSAAARKGDCHFDILMKARELKIMSVKDFGEGWDRSAEVTDEK